MAGPLLLKISYYDMKIDQSGAKNAVYVNYIATRPGADKGETEIGDKDFQSEVGSNAGYVKYMDERPRSHGLFGQSGETQDLQAVKDELRHHEGIVWRMIISLREEDAVKFGYIDRQSWENTLRSAFPEAAKAMGIRESNLRWVAAFHAEMGHPHVHLVCWEKNQERQVGLLGRGETKDIKRILLRDIYATERTRLLTEKTAMRDILRSMAKDSVSKEIEIIKSIQDSKLEVEALDGKEPGVPPKLWDDRQKELTEKLLKLSQIMPGKGRVALAYMPSEVKELARETSDYILSNSYFNDRLHQYIVASRNIASHYNSQEKALKEAENKAYEDIRDRISQVVLQSAKELQGLITELEKVHETEPEKIDIEAFNTLKEVVDNVVPSGGNDTLDRLYKSTFNLFERELLRIDESFKLDEIDNMVNSLRKEIEKDMQELANDIKDLEQNSSTVFLNNELKNKVNNFTLKLFESKIKTMYDAINKHYSKITDTEKLDKFKVRLADNYLKHAKEYIEMEKLPLEIKLHEERTLNAIDKMQSASNEFIKDRPDENEFTIRTMYRAYLMIGLQESEAFDKTYEWGKTAGIGNTTEYISKENERLEKLTEMGIELQMVGTKDWDRLRDNLGYEEEQFLKPWIGIVNKEKLPPEQNTSQSEHLKNIKVELVEERIPPVVYAFQGAVNINLKELPKDEIAWTLKTMNKVLYSVGVDDRLRENIVRDFFNKSNVYIPEKQFKDMFDRIRLSGDKEYFMGHEKWDKLCVNLSIGEDVKSPWKFQGETNELGRFARNVWKAAWRNLEAEKSKAQARANIEDIKAIYKKNKARGVEFEIDKELEK